MTLDDWKLEVQGVLYSKGYSTEDISNVKTEEFWEEYFYEDVDPVYAVRDAINDGHLKSV